MTLSSAKIADLPLVRAELNYLAPMAKRPRNYADDPPSGVPRTNAVPEPHSHLIRSARPVVSDLSLDEQGFALVQHASNVRDFYDDDEVNRLYDPEVEALLKAATGADRVFIFDHVARRHVRGAPERGDGPRQPVRRVHVDHTARSGPQRVRDFFPDEADELLRGRVQIINVWRPIRGPLRDTPLGVCDAQSVSTEDLVPTDLVYRHRTGETYSVTYNPAHRWFYVPEMAADEALLIKCYDSKTDGRARFAPHSAFTDPSTPMCAALRESIELRALVFHRE
jgi:hypothetical protein